MAARKRSAPLPQRAFAQQRGADCPYCHARGEVAGINGDERHAGFNDDSLIPCECARCGVGWDLVEAAVGYGGLNREGVTGTPGRELCVAAAALERGK